MSIAVIDEDSANVVLRCKETNNLANTLVAMIGHVDQVGSAVGGDDDLGVRVVENLAARADEPVSGNWALADRRSLLANRRIDWLVHASSSVSDEGVRVPQRKAKCMRKIDGNEPRRQEARIDLHPSSQVFVDELCRVAVCEVAVSVHLVPADSRESVVGGDKDVRIGRSLWVAIEVVENLLQVVVCVSHRCLRGWAIDAGSQRIEAVPLIVLSAISVSRPKQHGERLARRDEGRQDCLGQRVREELLLDQVGRGRSRGDRMKARLG